jgi:hypothetical protein
MKGPALGTSPVDSRKSNASLGAETG